MAVASKNSLAEAIRAFLAKFSAADLPPSVVPYSPKVNSYVKVFKNGFHFRNLAEILPTAMKHKFLVPAINIRSKYILDAVLEAAWEEKSPIIIECSESEIEYCNFAPERLVPMVYDRIDRMIGKYGYAVPCVMHLDHVQKDMTLIDRGVKAGYSSALADLSKKSTEENIKLSKEILKKYHPMGISFELEEGEIGIAESLADPEIDRNIEKYYTTVEAAYKIVAACRPDALAIFVGNGHGKYLKKPTIGFQRIKEISDALKKFGTGGESLPIVLHGGSYLDEETFKKCAAAGAAKVNYATSVSDIMFENMPAELVSEMDALGKEKDRPRRKVLRWFEDKIDALPKPTLQTMTRKMAEHIRHFMREGWLSSGKTDLYPPQTA